MRTLMLDGCDEGAFREFMQGDGWEVVPYEVGSIGGIQLPDGVSVPVGELPEEGEASDQVLTFTFWLRGDGPLHALGDAPRPETLEELRWRVAKEDRLGDRAKDAVDIYRSPVLQLHRTMRVGDDTLKAGTAVGIPAGQFLQDISRRRQDALQRVREWLMREGTRIAPPPEILTRRPTKRERQALIVWALPEAAGWRASGGVIRLD